MPISQLTNEPFTGYVFQGSPPRQPRLWFLDRQVRVLFPASDLPIFPLPVPLNLDLNAPLDLDVGAWQLAIREGLDRVPGICLRYNHRGSEPWTAVWRLTDTVIGHVRTFGRTDDVWRLGLWPD